MIKKGLKVKVLNGKNKNKEGEVIEVDRPKYRAKVKDLNIIKLDQHALRAAGLYRRAWSISPDNKKQKVDLSDGKPFSTDFSFTRFLIPHLNQYDGYAIFMDCDMMVRSDIMEVFNRYSDDVHAVSCVWHKYQPNNETKMDNQIQESYSMTNWSSFLLWNCGHKANLNLTVDDEFRNKIKKLYEK